MRLNRLRFGLKGKEALGVTALTLLVVSMTTLAHLSQLSKIVVDEALGQADLIAKQIYAQSSRSLARAPRRNPQEALRKDPDVRAALDTSVGYSPYLLYAMITGPTGAPFLHTERDKEGGPLPERPLLRDILKLNAFRRFQALYQEGTIYETTLPLSLNARPFGTIRLGIATSLLRKELNTSLAQTLRIAGFALPAAWLVAMGLATLTLRPIRKLTRDVERLRRGDFHLETSSVRDNEFGELAVQLQNLGQQLQADSLKMFSEKTHLQQVADHLEDGILFLNQDRQVLYFNKAAETLLTTTLEQALGWPLEALLPPTHALCTMVDQAFTEQTGFRNTAMTLEVEGRIKEYLVSAFVIMADPQRAMGAVLFIKDLESVRTFQSLISYSAKLTALGRLTSGLAHEVKNPLNAMMIHLELLKDKLPGSNESAQQSLEVIGSEIRRLDRVVQGFLKFIRPQDLALKPVNVNALLTHLANLVSAEWEKEHVRFESRFDSALPVVHADEELLHQAFRNILTNACQAMPKGGTVLMTTQADGPGKVMVSIADEGVGIPPKDLDQIFKLYYTTKADGNGIGLSLVYRIIQLHDGNIEVNSEVGRGTTFVVSLPVR